jgi:hypothetical protein
MFSTGAEDSVKVLNSSTGSVLSEAPLLSEGVLKLPHEDDRRVRVSAAV